MNSAEDKTSNGGGRIKLVEKLKEVVHSNGITDPVSEVIIKDAGMQGEAFASVSKLATVTFENAERLPLNLFVKTQTSNASHSEMLKEIKAFEKEGRFLTGYVSAAKEMCQQKGRKGFIDFYPKCYYGDEQIIVLENLVLDKGYELLDKALYQDLDAAKLALITLAKHHAVGHAMIQETGGVAAFFERFPHLDYETYDKPVFMDMFEPSFDNSIKSNLKILESSDVPGGIETASKLKDYLGKACKIVMEALLERDADTFCVLGHGDYWNNNMMFKRDKETQKLIHHVAIDFQITRYNTPATDLGYYLFTSVQYKVRQHHLEELLQLYTDTLNSVTEELGHPTNLTFEKVFLDFRKRVGFGFWLGMTMAVGPGMAIYKDIDISAIDVKDWVEVFDKVMLKWIEENPDQRADVAKELVLLMKEYENLRLDTPL